MPRIRFLVLFFLSTGVFSCDNDEESLVSFPSRFYKSGVEPIGALRVFSSQGPITAKSIVERFTELDKDYLSSSVSSVINEGIMDTIDFLESQHAVLDHQYSNRHCSMDIEGGIIILSATNISRECCFADDVFTRSLPYYIGKIKPEVYSEFIISSTRGYYLFAYTGQRKFVLTTSRGRLMAPMIHYIRHSGNTTSTGYLNNMLQSDFYKHIPPGDTLTLLESRVSFAKE